jgi:hypothetical protein
VQGEASFERQRLIGAGAEEIDRDISRDCDHRARHRASTVKREHGARTHRGGESCGELGKQMDGIVAVKPLARQHGRMH